MSLFGQLTVFHLVPRSALQLLGWDSFDGEGGALRMATIADQTRVLLEHWHARRGAFADDPQAVGKRPAGAGTSAPAKRAGKSAATTRTANATQRVKKPVSR
nr:hypothetical protein [Burkholderia ambifaria]